MFAKLGTVLYESPSNSICTTTLLLPPFYGTGNRSSESSRDLPEALELVRRRDGICAQDQVTPETVLDNGTHVNIELWLVLHKHLRI